MFEIGDEVIIIPPDNCNDSFIKYTGSIVTIASEQQESGCYDVVFDLQEVILASNPPQHKMYCNNCGWSHIEREEVYRIPYQLETVPVSFIPEACRYCSNHPSNGGSGICNCILGVSPATC